MKNKLCDSDTHIAHVRSIDVRWRVNTSGGKSENCFGEVGVSEGIADAAETVSGMLSDITGINARAAVCVSASLTVIRTVISFETLEWEAFLRE